MSSLGMGLDTQLSQVRLIAGREISTKVRSKAFIISTAILALIAFGSVLFMGLAGNIGLFDEDVSVAVVDGTAVNLDPDTFVVTPVADRAAAEKLVESGEVDAALVQGGTSLVNLTVIAKSDPPIELINALSVAPDVAILEADGPNPLLAMLVSLGFALVFMMSAVTFGVTIAQSVVEEKQTRIVEILLATVRPRVLFAGKIIGNSVLAIGQVVLLVGLAGLGMLLTGQQLLFGELGMALIWFAALFLLGFVLLATMYAAAGALVSRQEDIGSVTSPMMLLIMIPYMLVIFFNTNELVLGIMSYVPFSAPVGMPMRLYLGQAQWWEPVASGLILLISIAVAVVIGARIYENSILRIGSRVKLMSALRGSYND